jgi:hypothetical protein
VIFIESSSFTRSIVDYLRDDHYRELQQVLVQNPAAGAVMPECAGLRKIRFRDPQRGKGSRVGLRVIYLYLPEQSWVFLLDIYGKDEKDDLGREEKKGIGQFSKSHQRGGKREIKRGVSLCQEKRASLCLIG